MVRVNKRRVGGWLPSNPEVLRKWLSKLIAKPTVSSSEYVQPIQELQDLVANTLSLQVATAAMFTEAYKYDKNDPTGDPALTSWPQFLGFLNHIMMTAPEFILDSQADPAAQGLVGFPINALLD